MRGLRVAAYGQSQVASIKQERCDYLLTGQTDIDRVSYSNWLSFTQRCVHVDPDKRPTIKQAQRELQKIRT